MSDYTGKYNFKLDLQSPLRNAFLNKITHGSTILEFGSATGFVTQYLRDVLKCKVYIVEIEQGAFEVALEFAEDGMCGDMEVMHWEEQFAGVGFDYVLFADVLEHLKNPLDALKRAKSLLKNNGCFIITVPNVAYSGVLLSLMHNTFLYTMHGILDDTHLRFFTRESFSSLLTEAGLFVADVEEFGKELVESEFARLKETHPQNIAQYVLGKNWANVYQYLFVATKVPLHNEVKGVLDTDTIPVQIYYDFGDGFSEEHKLSVICKTGNGELQFSLPTQAVVGRLRVDIMSNVGLMCSDIYVYGSEGPPICPIDSNALFEHNGIGYYVFGAAQILIDLSGFVVQPTEINLMTLHYQIQVDYGICDQSPVFRAFSLEKTHSEEQLLSTRIESEQLRQELDSARIESEQLRQELDSARIESEQLRQELAGSLVENGRKSNEISHQILLLAHQDKEIMLQDDEIFEKSRRIVTLNEELKRREEYQKECMRQFENTLAEIYASTSWKLTRPLRSIKEALRFF